MLEPNHLLIVSNGFPNYFNPLDGIFYYDQAIALKKTFPNLKVGYLSVNPIGIKHFLKKPNFFKLGRKSFSTNGVEFITLSYINIPIIRDFDVNIALKYLPQLFKKYIERFDKPQIIHLQSFEAGLAVIDLKNKFKIPYLITEHSSKFLNNKLTIDQEEIAQQVFNQSSLNLAVSNYFAKILSSRFKLPFSTMPNMVKMEENNVINENITKVYEVINVGTFNENKNQILLLQTLAKYKFGKVLLIGEGETENYLREFVKSNDLNEFVDFLPFQSRIELMRLMKKSVCLTITSKHETFGVVAIEALANGTPVISTNAGGPSDIIEDGVNGFIIDSNPDELYQAYQKISKNLFKFAPIVLMKYAENHFSEKAVAQKLFNSYKSILSSSNG